MQIKLLAPLVVSALLVACGGGGGDSGGSEAINGVADAYVGTWVACGVTVTNSSIKASVVATKTSATSIAYTYTETNYASADCSGTGVPDYTETGGIAFKGTKVIGVDTVNMGEATITSDNDPNTTEPRVERDISLIEGNTIYFGDGSLGPDGYPTALDKTVGLTRQ